MTTISFSLLLYLALCFAGQLVYSHQAYSHDSNINVPGGNSWMKRIGNNVNLGRISIPGTHDSVSFHNGGIPTGVVETQSVPLKQQLEAGIRALDIRCRHFKNAFPIHHGMVFQQTFFNNILDIVTDFLKRNPSETVLMRVKEEHKPAENTRTFPQTFEHYTSKLSTHIWKPTSDNPTLGEVRGKIVILDDFTPNSPRGITKYGLSYRALRGVTQDDYELNDIWGLHSKWDKIKTHLLKASQSKQQNFYINYLSGSSVQSKPGLVRPYFVASGKVNSGTNSDRLPTGKMTRDKQGKGSYPDFPRQKCTLGVCMIYFEGTNILTYEFIKKNSLKYVGIIYADFPGPGLINEIIQSNFK